MSKTSSGSRRRATKQAWLAVTALLIGSGLQQAIAHSWYPPLCCNEIDCSPVTAIVYNKDGSILMEAGHISVLVPKGFPVEPSQDSRAHVCVYRDVRGRYHPRCVFLPAET
jgi:hypothetical protein